jgi:hypothetical protein
MIPAVYNNKSRAFAAPLPSYCHCSHWEWLVLIVSSLPLGNVQLAVAPVAKFLVPPLMTLVVT